MTAAVHGPGRAATSGPQGRKQAERRSWPTATCKAAAPTGAEPRSADALCPAFEGRSELGPVLPSKAAVFMQARELQALAARAVEFAGTGPTADLAAALQQFDSMRAILGEPKP